MEFRTLRADEIECRVASVRKNGVQLLLYKDARCDMNILDEQIGAYNWQRDHKELKGNIYCGVGILSSERSEWIWKWDAGAESYTEKEKGEASDSFKRACVNWGIGRELYTSPFIWIKPDFCNIEQFGDRYTCKERFKVRLIEYQNKAITYLVIENKKGEIVYTYGKHMTARDMLRGYCMEHGLDMNDIADKYELNKDSSDDEFAEAVEDLRNGQ